MSVSDQLQFGTNELVRSQKLNAIVRASGIKRLLATSAPGQLFTAVGTKILLGYFWATLLRQNRLTITYNESAGNNGELFLDAYIASAWTQVGNDLFSGGTDNTLVSDDLGDPLSSFGDLIGSDRQFRLTASHYTGSSVSLKNFVMAEGAISLWP